MRVLRFFAVPLLIPLLSIGCAGVSERDEPEAQFEMSLLAQDEKGELYAPIKGEVESSSKGSEQPQASSGYSMHNHLLVVDAPYAYWLIHRDGFPYPDGVSCAPVELYHQVCTEIALYIGASVGQIYNAHEQCPVGYWNDAYCVTY